jgi:hypothetical protein
MPIINSNAFKRLHNIPVSQSLSLQEIAKLSGFPISALQEVYNRGIGAHATNLQSVRTKGTFKKNEDKPASQKLSKEQWAMARVYSFVMKRKTTYGKADQDIVKKYTTPKGFRAFGEKL